MVILHVNMFHYFKIPYITCTFTYNEYIGPLFYRTLFVRKIASAPPLSPVLLHIKTTHELIFLLSGIQFPTRFKQFHNFHQTMRSHLLRKTKSKTKWICRACGKKLICDQFTNTCNASNMVNITTTINVANTSKNITKFNLQNMWKFKGSCPNAPRIGTVGY